MVSEGWWGHARHDEDVDVAWVSVQNSEYGPSKCVIRLAGVMSVKFEYNELSTVGTHVFLGSDLIAVCTTAGHAKNLETNLNNTYMKREYRTIRESQLGISHVFRIEKVHATSTEENARRSKILRSWIDQLLPSDYKGRMVDILKNVDTYLNADTGKTIREYMSFLKHYSGLSIQDFGGWTNEKLNIYQQLTGATDEERIENNAGIVMKIGLIRNRLNA